MPTPEQILQGLTALSNDWRGVAVAWHVAVAAFVAALVAGWRPSSRLAGTLLALPVASVSVMGLVGGNPFNSGVFAVLTIVLVVAAGSLPRRPVSVGTIWQIAVGSALFAFGFTYPHFVSATSWTTYLYAAPAGLIPCPTLSVVGGLALVLGGLESRPWSLALATAALVYGFVGVFRLGVTIDIALLAGAVALAVTGWTAPRAPRAPERATGTAGRAARGQRWGRDARWSP